MKITSDWLREQGACSDGTEWFLHQKETNAIKVARKLISQNKVNWANWLLTHLMTKKQLTTYAIYAAKLSLKSFETLYPQDDRPRKAIEAALVYVKNPSPETQSAARSAASAARSAAESAAWSAASAAESAAYAAWSAASAAESAARSAASAARSAASAAESAASAACSAAWSAAWSAALKKILLYGISLLVKR